eukprot:TRINITY_DN8835_c0_g5_i1.p1 TRINITY_DN8835_c0_g5~~TRINITY_DN8835_c0_g5_i1.p1  ORF type:complete len:240 (+),score=54.36 TRINITY_DN8835_c0_g5_i1:416-1135(+)
MAQRAALLTKPKSARSLLERVKGATLYEPPVPKRPFDSSVPQPLANYYTFMLDCKGLESRRTMEGLTPFDDDPIWVTDKYYSGTVADGFRIMSPKDARAQNQIVSKADAAGGLRFKQIRLMEKDVELRLKSLPKMARRSVYIRGCIAKLHRINGMMRLANPHVAREMKHRYIPKDGTIDVRRDLTATLPHYLPAHMEFNWKARRALHVGDHNTSGVDVRSHLPQRLNGFWTMFLCKHTG